MPVERTKDRIAEQNCELSCASNHGRKCGGCAGHTTCAPDSGADVEGVKEMPQELISDRMVKSSSLKIPFTSVDKR